jgi:predicted MFS family arabinose efflux permease
MSSPALTPPVVLLLSVTAGTAVSLVYYVQPLLDTIATDLNVSAGAAGLLVTASQIGFAFGLAFLVPLGDLLDRRRLVAGMLAASGLVSLAAGLAPTFSVLCALLVLAGITSAAAQIVVPFAASLAAEDQRGRITGTVMSGLLLGILLARTISGAIAEIGGWRLVYFVAAILVALLALLVWRMLPSVTTPATTSYAGLLHSVLVLVREHPVLRGRMALGLLSMAQFSAMWTASSFLLARTYHFSDGVIGLFGLAGAAGALGAPLAGRLADRGHGHHASTAAWLCLLAGWGLLAWGNHNLTALIIGMLVFDLGAQGAQISNQNKIYALDPDARSRITTAYMVTYFIGGVLGSVIAGYTYQLSDWTAVCTLGATTAATGLILWGLLHRLIEHEPNPRDVLVDLQRQKVHTSSPGANGE